MFSADESAPRLVEVEGRVCNADADGEPDQTIWAPYFTFPAATQNEVVSVGELWRPASDDGSDPTADIPCNLVFSNRLCAVFYDPADNHDASGAKDRDLEDNLAVQAATEGAVTHWKGNVVAYREYEAGGQVKYVDVTIDDLPALVHWFLRKHGEPDELAGAAPPGPHAAFVDDLLEELGQATAHTHMLQARLNVAERDVRAMRRELAALRQTVAAGLTHEDDPEPTGGDGQEAAFRGVMREELAWWKEEFEGVVRKRVILGFWWALVIIPTAVVLAIACLYGIWKMMAMGVGHLDHVRDWVLDQFPRAPYVEPEFPIREE